MVPKKIKRILYITSIDISLPKGPSINEREFIWSLYDKFHENVHFLITGFQRPVPETDHYHKTFLTKINKKRPLTYLHHQIDLYQKGSWLLNNNSFDLIVVRIELLSIGLFFLIRKFHIPYAIKHLSGYPRNFLKTQKGKKLFVGRIIAPLDESLMSWFARNTIAADACTEGHINGALSNFGIERDKIFLIDNATNTGRLRTKDKYVARNQCGLSHFDPIVGFVGGRPWERGGMEMIRVAAHLIRMFPRIGFVIVGGGDGMETLFEAAEKAGVKEHFVFPGIVPYDNVPEYINSFDVGIAFDRTDIINEIGNSNQKIRQYIACGKPVITSPSGSDFVVENGLGSVIHHQDIEQIANQLVRWLSLNEFEKQEHEKKAVAYAREHLSITNALEKRLEFWEKNWILRTT